MLLLCADFSLGVQAATYYIDAISGNDVWSGTVNVPTGTPQSNGPWRTLARVQSATLAAGDTVLLRCDQTWRESLVISATGTAAAPILIHATIYFSTLPGASIRRSAFLPASVRTRDAIIDGIAIFTGIGLFNIDVLIAVALLMPVMALGMWCGHRLHGRLSRDQAIRFIGGLLLLSGISLLVRAFAV